MITIKVTQLNPLEFTIDPEPLDWEELLTDPISVRFVLDSVIEVPMGTFGGPIKVATLHKVLHASQDDLKAIYVAQVALLVTSESQERIREELARE